MFVFETDLKNKLTGLGFLVLLCLGVVKVEVTFLFHNLISVSVILFFYPFHLFYLFLF